MKKKRINKRIIWDGVNLHYLIRKDFKQKFDKKITTQEINSIWKSYVEEAIVKPLEKGEVVYVNEENRFWVKAERRCDNERFMTLLSKGLMLRNGKVVKADINLDTSDYIYDVVFETKTWKQKNKLYFNPHNNIKKRVRESIIKGKLNTRTYVS